MKRVFLPLLSLMLIVLSCDIIEGPYLEVIDDNGNTDEVNQKVLLEKFTGHQCVNCPDGTIIANQIHELYGSKFITIAYHAGFFARTSASFPIDYRTTEGTALNSHFGVTLYPTGVVNRKMHNGSVKLDKSIWASASAEAIEVAPKLSLVISKNYDAVSRTLNVTVNAKAVTELDALKLCVFVTESGLVSPQVASGGTIAEYQHNHVFRTSLNGTWGQDLFSQGAIASQTQTVSVSGVLNSAWNAQNMSIVSFAYSNVTGEVIQVEEAKVIE